MKKMNLCLALCMALSIIGCKQEGSNTEAATSATTDSVVIENTIPPMDAAAKSETDLSTVNGTFKVESPSSIGWTGSKPSGSHVGTINISDGTLELKDGQITGGSFNIDMNSIISTDLKPDSGKDKLENHLKSADFFDVAKYPKAVFTIKKSEPVAGDDKTKHKITGDLTIKDVTKELSLDAFVIASDNGSVITATTPSFEINRVDYGIKYNSGVLNTVKDKIINDNVGLVINIRAKK